ncbi:hypothetical protein [Akkermansia sp.]|nr:hypothetical protein [Akkermansia sp.]MEE0533719.1 hypothetical protein [Akkermansia sp.]
MKNQNQHHGDNAQGVYSIIPRQGNIQTTIGRRLSFSLITSRQQAHGDISTDFLSAFSSMMERFSERKAFLHRDAA